MISLLHVSISTSSISPFHQPRAITQLAADARVKNAVIGVTGALVLARDKFAQVIEGDGEIVDELMSSIKADARHTSVNIVALEEIAERRFDQWSMAYVPRSPFIEGLITPLLRPSQLAPQRQEAVRRLQFVLARLASGGQAAACG